MKNTKKGFSLAELLIVVAIISVIATMGFTISSKGIDKAFGLYAYNGYQSIGQAMGEITSTNTDQIETDLCGIFNGASKDNTTIAGQTVVKTTNGIRYNIIARDANSYFIDMYLPARKKKTDALPFNVTRLVYIPDSDYGVIIPIDVSGGYNLSTRKDLLPFYVDDGEVGRVIMGEYKPRTYTDFRTAFCSVHGAVSGLVDCTGLATKNKIGAIVVTNPQRI